MLSPPLRLWQCLLTGVGRRAGRSRPGGGITCHLRGELGTGTSLLSGTRFYEKIDKGNIEAIDELAAEEYINHDPPPFPGLAPGRAGLKQAFEMFWKATPGRHVIEDQIVEGDKVVTRLRGVGKHEGELAGIPPTGNDLDVKAIAIHRIQDGKIGEHWSAVDTATLLH